MISFDRIAPPKEGTGMSVRDGRLVVPDDPVVCVIEGDGVGPEVIQAACAVIDRAVKLVYATERRIVWLRLYAGGQGIERYGDPLPEDTLKAIAHFRIALKGPLATPIGGGHRSLNVAIRQRLNLFAGLRPVKYISGVPNPVKHPERVDMVVFRENLEDVYAGIEWRRGTEEALKLIRFLNEQMGASIPEDSGIGVKPMSETCTKQLVRLAIDYALAHNRRSVTLVTKGNIMKYTEGAFRAWGYEVARDEYADRTVTEQELQKEAGGLAPKGQVVIKDRLADNMLQQVLLYPEHYDVIATPNLNGDYLSDALAAQVGGLGIAPGANLGHRMGVFEATHGTAPDIAGRGLVNPSAAILSGALMLEYMGWTEAAGLIRRVLEITIASGRVTRDLALQMDGATELSTRQFENAVLEELGRQGTFGNETTTGQGRKSHARQ